MIRPVHIVAAALALSVAAGCAGPQTGQVRPPAYADGFNDGCQSGKAAQSYLERPRKDIGQFESNPQYAQGWSDGYQKCEYEQMQKNASGR